MTGYLKFKAVLFRTLDRLWDQRRSSLLAVSPEKTVDQAYEVSLRKLNTVINHTVLRMIDAGDRFDINDYEKLEKDLRDLSDVRVTVRTLRQYENKLLNPKDVQAQLQGSIRDSGQDYGMTA